MQGWRRFLVQRCLQRSANLLGAAFWECIPDFLISMISRCFLCRPSMIARTGQT
jgi:hypothetical protein